MIYQFLLMGFGSIAASTPVVGAILLLAIGGWIMAVRSLGRQFQHLTDEKQVIFVPDEEKEEELTPRVS